MRHSRFIRTVIFLRRSSTGMFVEILWKRKQAHHGVEGGLHVHAEPVL